TRNGRRRRARVDGRPDGDGRIPRPRRDKHRQVKRDAAETTALYRKRPASEATCARRKRATVPSSRPLAFAVPEAKMFENVTTAPADPILGLTEAFKKDPRPNKINLSVGDFQDATGTTPILASVKAAERRLLEAEKTKNYRPIDGDPDYGRRVRELLFGADDERVSSGRAVTAHTPGGTGALRVVGDLLRDLR